MSDSVQEPKQETVETTEPKETVETKTESKTLSAKDAARVKKQIEFYFSDSNYPKDKFLQETAKQHKEGFIPLSVLTTFNRLKQITTDLDQIKKALSDSDVVMVNDDEKPMIKRKHPVPEKLNTDERTVHARGVDKEKTLEELETFFSQFGSVKAIRVIKDKKTKKSTGSLYLELGSKEEADKLAEMKTVSWDDTEVHVQTREAQMKFQKEKLLGKRNEPEVPTFEPGLLVQFKGMEEGNEFKAMDLKNFFKEQADAQYVEFITGDSEGICRCASAGEATKLAASTVPFNDITLAYAIIEGEAEKMYWTRVAASKKEKRSGGRNNGGNNRGKKRRY